MSNQSSEKQNEILLMFKEDLEKEKKYLRKIYIKSVIGSFFITFSILLIVAFIFISKIGVGSDIVRMVLCYAVSFLVGQMVLYFLIFKLPIISMYIPFKRIKRRALSDIEYNLKDSYKLIKYILSKAELKKPELDNEVLLDKNYKVFYEYLLSEDYTKCKKDLEENEMINLNILMKHEKSFKESFSDLNLVSELTEAKLKAI